MRRGGWMQPDHHAPQPGSVLPVVLFAVVVMVAVHVGLLVTMDPGFLQGRLADPDANAGEQQVREILRQSAQCGHAAPDRERGGDQPRAVGARFVRIAGDRQAQHGVEQRECQPRHQADLLIAEVQVLGDRLGQDVDDLPIDKIEDVDDQQDPQRR